MWLGPIAAVAALVAAPTVTLHAGEARWFTSGELSTGDIVRCVEHGRSIDVPLPAPPAGSSIDYGTDWLRGASLQIARRAGGATQLACGEADVTPHRAVAPFVIGQNGVALIRGPIRLADLAKRFGRPTIGTASGGCHSYWLKAGLRAIFAGSCARPGAMRSASVANARWTTLQGVRVGDSLARMRWEAPGARPIGGPGHRWVVSKAIASSSQLVATVGRDGRVIRLTCVLG